MLSLNDIFIRTTLRAGDLGYITYLHGSVYHSEKGYGLSYEAYVAKTLVEFYENYDPALSRFWICEHEGKIIASIALVDRGPLAQLRYFLILPPYRGIGLGKKLMALYMDYLKERGYRKSFLLTTDELPVAARIYGAAGFKLVESIPSTAFGKSLLEQRYEWTCA